MKRLLLFAALIAWSGMASAVVYKWVDAQGKVQYGDRPPDGVHAEVVELLGTHVARQPAETAKPDSSSSASNAQKPAQTANTAKNQVADDVAQAREKQCTDAQERYKKLIEGRRLYKTGTNGEREYLTSEEIDKERLDAKNDVDTICNSTT
jgi:hypothetical protein